MAGRIRAEDVVTVKERSSLEDVVREHVTLRQAGPGSLKGLCPFHDEKSPSFNVRPAVGAWHCFGCGEGGDVITFVQKVDHLTFAEAVERLAAKVGMELRYEEGGRPAEQGLGRRSRLVEAHRAAAELYAAQLVSAPEARPARDFLRERGFDRAAAERFGVGFSPRGGEVLTAQLRRQGFGEDELVAAGLSAKGQRGAYDRFRGRLMWPIRDITGDVVGFGARRLFDDDRIEAKYLNTAETAIYKKSQVLYGLDLAKKAIARDRQAVVVEGYTDVMACHLAGVEQAVATCGTAFGADHIKLLRRIMRDESDGAPARTVFTFDGDAAGQQAAMRAFGEDQRFVSQSYVAVEAGGKDPCELRQSAGDAAVRELVEDAVPMFEFAVRTTIRRFALDTAEGRVQAVRAAAPIVAGIRDRALRPEYTRAVAGWVGVEVEQVADEVARAGRRAVREDRVAGRPPSGTDAGDGDQDAVVEPEGLPRPDLRDPVVALERQLLQCVLQFPAAMVDTGLDRVDGEALTAPAHRAVYDAVLAAGGPAAARTTGAWAAAVTDAALGSVRPLVSELAVAPVPTRFDPATGVPEQRYLDDLVQRVREGSLRRRIADSLGALRRLGAEDADAARALGIQLQGLQRELAGLQARLA